MKIKITWCFGRVEKRGDLGALNIDVVKSVLHDPFTEEHFESDEEACQGYGLR